jgi:superfamily II DNA/RNA helicase
VIGGKNLKDERERLTRMNILVATPGRLLQHMDQTIGFECDNLQMLGVWGINNPPISINVIYCICSAR